MQRQGGSSRSSSPGRRPPVQQQQQRQKGKSGAVVTTPQAEEDDGYDGEEDNASSSDDDEVNDQNEGENGAVVGYNHGQVNSGSRTNKSKYKNAGQLQKSSDYDAESEVSVQEQPGGGGFHSTAEQYGYGRDVMALPIEMPDTVTDPDAFRRYLSQPYYESVGTAEGWGPGVGPVRTRKSKSKNNSGSGTGDLTRKTACLCFAIVSLALLSASTAHLRFFIAYSQAHAYPGLNYFLLYVSIIIEVLAGIGYVVIAKFPLKPGRANTAFGWLTVGLFIVAVNNVVISAFVFDDHVCEVIAKHSGVALDAGANTPVSLPPPLPPPPSNDVVDQNVNMIYQPQAQQL